MKQIDNDSESAITTIESNDIDGKDLQNLDNSGWYSLIDLLI